MLSEESDRPEAINFLRKIPVTGNAHNRVMQPKPANCSQKIEVVGFPAKHKLEALQTITYGDEIKPSNGLCAYRILEK